jgi:hypothetical protein
MLTRGEAQAGGGEALSRTPALFDACADVALGRGTLVRLDAERVLRADDGDDPRFGPRRRGPLTAEFEGFNLQAAIRIEAADDEGRERLARYCGRPAFALGRLSVLPDGHIAYEIKVPTRRATHRVMTSVELLARLAALVPPPRYPLVRYHGVLAPHSKWREAVVPRPPAHAAPATCPAPEAPPMASPKAPTGADADAGGGVPSPRPAADHLPRTSTGPDTPQPEAPAAHDAFPPTDRLAGHAPAPDRMPPPPSVALISPGDVEITPQGISVRHLDRLLDGLLLATSPRVDWARLLRRTFGFDVLACARCQGRLRLLSAITEPETVRRILKHLRIPATAPPVPRCRDPAGDDGTACTSAAPVTTTQHASCGSEQT